MWPTLYTPVGTLKYKNLNYRITRFATLVEELINQNFSGYIEILAPHEHGLLILYNGRICNCFYEGTEELNLSREEIIRHFLRTQSRERDSIINVGELNPRVIVALSALESRKPAHRELETVFLDMPKLFETLARKHFTGSLRFYRIRNNTRLGNILLRMKKITADQLREAIRLQLSGEKALRLGDALVQIGAIGKHDLEEALDRQSSTRKGSDLELAMALFSEGEFLGGYQYSGKGMVRDRREVIGWLGTSETLMDIIDGLMPSEIDIETILYPDAKSRKRAEPLKTKAGAKPQKKSKPEMPPPKAETPVSKMKDRVIFTEKEQKPAEEDKDKTALGDTMIQELTQETFMLKADDLILDIYPHPEAPPIPDDEGPADKNLGWLDDLVGGEEGPIKDDKEREKLEKIAENILSSEVDKKTAQELQATDMQEQKGKAGVLEETGSDLPPLLDVISTAPGQEQKEAEEEEKEDEGEEEETRAMPERQELQAQTSASPKTRSLEAIEKVLQEHMGFLGLALLEREKRYFKIPAVRNVNVTQIKNVNQRLLYSIGLIMGEKQAEKIMFEIEEKTGR